MPAGTHPHSQPVHTAPRTAGAATVSAHCMPRLGFPEAITSAYCWCCDCVYALHAATIAFLKQMPVRALQAAWCFLEAMPGDCRCCDCGYALRTAACGCLPWLTAIYIPMKGSGGWEKKSKNSRISAPKLRRVRLELPGASRKSCPDLLPPCSCVLPSTTGWVR